MLVSDHTLRDDLDHLINFGLGLSGNQVVMRGGDVR
jgi:hypothetical protein